MSVSFKLSGDDYSPQTPLWLKIVIIVFLLVIGAISTIDPVKAAVNGQQEKPVFDDIGPVCVEADYKYEGKGDPNLSVPSEDNQLVYLKDAAEMKLSMQNKGALSQEYSFVLSISKVLPTFDGIFKVGPVSICEKSQIRAPDDYSEFTFRCLELEPAIYLIKMAVEIKGDRESVKSFFVCIGEPPTLAESQ